MYDLPRCRVPCLLNLGACVHCSVNSPFPSSSIWRIENAFGTFVAHMDVNQPPPFSAYDLREFLRYSQVTPTATTPGSTSRDQPSSPSQSSRRLDMQVTLPKTVTSPYAALPIR